MFRVGDRIKCINILGAHSELILGKIYTVLSMLPRDDADYYVRIEPVPGFAGLWLIDRFVLVSASQECSRQCVATRYEGFTEIDLYCKECGFISKKLEDFMDRTCNPKQ